MKTARPLVLVLALGAGMTTTTLAVGQSGAADLSAEEVAGLFTMREEEKLARDVYLTLGAAWSVPIFDNIAASEQQHMDAVKGLLDTYGLDDPAAGNEVGEFTDPLFTGLYAQLVEQGSQGVDDAYRVGVAIEELDINDLQVLLDQTTQRDIERVYTSLLKGSFNHLDAFSSMLAAALPGDYDGSGLVDQGDLDLVLQNWGSDTDAVGVPGGWVNDLPLGQIEQTELDSVLQNWGSASTPDFVGTSVPEPATLALLATGLLAARRRRGAG